MSLFPDRSEVKRSDEINKYKICPVSTQCNIQFIQQVLNNNNHWQ